MSVDLNSIKENVQSILQAANTTTASVDLSTGLETRVQRVLKVNPNRIPIQATWYPFVTVFVESKSIELETIAINQLNGKRIGELDLKIVGAVWNSTVTDDEEDPADDDCESLMENIEEIIRRNQDLNGTILWSAPQNTAYYNAALDEETHVRVGIFGLQAKVRY